MRPPLQTLLISPDLGPSLLGRVLRHPARLKETDVERLRDKVLSEFRYYSA